MKTASITKKSRDHRVPVERHVEGEPGARRRRPGHADHRRAARRTSTAIAIAATARKRFIAACISVHARRRLEDARRRPQAEQHERHAADPDDDAEQMKRLQERIEHAKTLAARHSWRIVHRQRVGPNCDGPIKQGIVLRPSEEGAEAERMSKLCSVCGTENRDEAQFCRACGTAFSRRPAAAVAAADGSCRQRLRRMRLPEQAGHPLLRQLRHEPRGVAARAARRATAAPARARRRAVCAAARAAADHVRVVRDRSSPYPAPRRTPTTRRSSTSSPRPTSPIPTRRSRCASRRATQSHGDTAVAFQDRAGAESRAADPRHRRRCPGRCRRRRMAVHGQLEPGAAGRGAGAGIVAPPVAATPAPARRRADHHRGAAAAASAADDGGERRRACHRRRVPPPPRRRRPARHAADGRRAAAAARRSGGRERRGRSQAPRRREAARQGGARQGRPRGQGQGAQPSSANRPAAAAARRAGSAGAPARRGSAARPAERRRAAGAAGARRAGARRARDLRRPRHHRRGGLPVAPVRPAPSTPTSRSVASCARPTSAAATCRTSKRRAPTPTRGSHRARPDERGVPMIDRHRVRSALPAGLSGHAFSSLFQAVNGLRNRRADHRHARLHVRRRHRRRPAAGDDGTLGFLAGLLALLVWVVAIGTGVNAAGLLQMDHARGISPRSTADALVYGLMCIPKLIVLGLALRRRRDRGLHRPRAAALHLQDPVPRAAAVRRRLPALGRRRRRHDRRPVPLHGAVAAGDLAGREHHARAGADASRSSRAGSSRRCCCSSSSASSASRSA